MRDEDLQSLATRLAHIYPIQERRAGALNLMNPAMRKGVIVELARLQLSEDYVPDPRRAIESLETALEVALEVLAMRPPLPFGVVIDGVATGDIRASEAITELLGAKAKTLTSLADNYIGTGLRSVYEKDGRRYDARLEPLFADPSKFYMNIDANNFGLPANSRQEIISEVSRVHGYFSTELHQAFDSLLS
ncbi:MAG: hypothetical protein WB681_07480 [Candidatus Cybelea sp.]